MTAASSFNPNAPGASAKGAKSSAISANSEGRSELEFVIRWCFAEFDGAFAPADLVQRGVYERRFVAFEEGMRDVDILVDHHLRGHVAARNELIDRRAQYRAQDGIHPAQLPIRRQALRDGAVDFVLVMRHAAHEIAKEFQIRFAECAQFIATETMLDEFLDHFLGIEAGQFHLINGLHRRQTCGAARLMCVAHRWTPSLFRVSISAMQARAASPPLSLPSCAARTSACSSFSTVRMPLPMQSP